MLAAAESDEAEADPESEPVVLLEPEPLSLPLVDDGAEPELEDGPGVIVPDPEEPVGEGEPDGEFEGGGEGEFWVVEPPEAVMAPSAYTLTRALIPRDKLTTAAVVPPSYHGSKRWPWPCRRE